MKKLSTLVRNEASKQYSRVTFNMAPAKTRLDTLEGREHLVIPMVILTEGVHAGSQGPLFYPKDELAKTPVVWNQKPIVVYHPTLNGEGISACDPAIVNTRKVGVIMNTRFEGGRLKSEAWIEKDRANAVDERIMAAVDNKEMMELSTGLFVDVENTTGKWKNEDYQGIARNFRPDHLALLPDQIGACSIADGAGLLRNQALRDPALRGILFKLGLVDNELSHSDIHSALTTAIRTKFNLGDNGPFIWIADVFDNEFVYEKDAKFWRLGYMSNDTGVSLSNEDPVQVQRRSEWKPVATANQNKPETMNKAQLIAAILAANCGLVEADKETLNNMTDAQLQAVANMVKEHPTINCFGLKKEGDKVSLIVKNTAPPAPAPAVPPVPSPSPAQEATVAPATNVAQQPKVVTTVQEYISAAPREVQDVLANSMAVYNEEKRKLITQILANKRNIFTQQDLENRPLFELKALAQLAAPEPPPNLPQPPHYYGQAPVGNNDKIEVLTLPTMNFEKPEKKTAAA